MPPDLIETDRGIADRIPATEHPTGHDLLAVGAWLPGTRPTTYAIELSTGSTYRARYWRCRACGAEKNRPDDFDAVCPGWPPEPVVTDGGSSVEDDRTDRARSAELTVEFVTFGPGYSVVEADGSSYIVDIEAETCRCAESRDTGVYCEHLRRADLAVRTGELPWPDGCYVR